MRGPTRRRPRPPIVHLPGPGSLHGVFPVDVPGESSRHRDLPARCDRSFTHGNSRQGVALDHRGCERASGLAHLSRVRSSVDRYGTRSLRRDDFGVQIDSTVYALDSTTIDLCLALFPWARYRKNQAAVKMHTLLNLRGIISANDYPEPMRRVRFTDPETGERLAFLSNHLGPAGHRCGAVVHIAPASGAAIQVIRAAPSAYFPVSFAARGCCHPRRFGKAVMAAAAGTGQQ